ncbi:ubiquitin-conjugating enzyme/RWD-like protein [Dioszegia hungarica]|uniref:E2 ubiquitin-conjugating enzyme n=1 Tax=Dioszegia hungarica TaxID=4972 RepID=A0AA38H8K9_9TREE|nr:ubiquitin-conjugating enzyme/RWD-like protein [Dioszegia hungarica]KAI9634894.1 ubiquitin-conjugating enzyme/RWD-like protein [Dioszegia hungarica]
MIIAIWQSLSSQALRQLSREITTLRSDPPEGVRVVVDEEDLTCLEGLIQGPGDASEAQGSQIGTPYEGGYYRVRFEFTSDYPNVPPKCTMMTKIFHPNVSKGGEICVDTLKKGWKREYGVGHVLVTVKCLLIYPNPESALDEEAGKQLLADYEGYCKYARLMTSIHATPKLPPAEFRASLSSSRSHSTTSVATIATTATNTSSSKLDAAPAPASALTATSAKLAPLGQNTRQEQSPLLPSDGKMADAAEVDGRALRPLTVTPVVVGAKVAGAKKAVAGGAKRGLKRL